MNWIFRAVVAQQPNLPTPFMQIIPHRWIVISAEEAAKIDGLPFHQSIIHFLLLLSPGVTGWVLGL
jgi:hypothetical protein